MNIGNDKETTISLDRVCEKPAHRISRLIREKYWNDLTRKMDKEGLINVLQDDKMKSETFYVYIPYNDKIAFNYYNNLSKDLNIEVVRLPKKITPEYVLSINEKPGLIIIRDYMKMKTKKFMATHLLSLEVGLMKCLVGIVIFNP